MDYGNPAIIVMVIAVVACVLGLTFFAVYYLNKIVDQNGRDGGSARKPEGSRDVAVRNWLETTSYAEWAGQSWGWALALTIHAFGTATVVGLAFIIGLRLFGLFGTIPYTSMNKLVPFIWFAAACRILSGVTLWITKP